MSSLAKTTKRSKKARRLGPVRVLRPEQYEGFDVETKVECIGALIPLGLMRIHELLEEEVCTLAGTWYGRKSPALPGRRHGSNAGSVKLAGQRHPLRIPRVQHVAGGELSPYRRWTTSEARGSWMRSCSNGCCMGFRVGMMKPPLPRSPEPLVCRVRRCLGPLRKPAPSSSRPSKTAT